MMIVGIIGRVFGARHVVVDVFFILIAVIAHANRTGYVIASDAFGNARRRSHGLKLTGLASKDGTKTPK